MAQNEIKNDLFMLGINGETYQKLLEIAKKQGKSVVDVTSDALKTHIETSGNLKESTREKKILLEG